MKVKVGGYVLYLGRLRSDGYRNVERVRLTNWRALLPSLRRAKIRSVMDDKRLLVQPDDPNQLLLPFTEAGGTGALCLRMEGFLRGTLRASAASFRSPLYMRRITPLRG